MPYENLVNYTETDTAERIAVSGFIATVTDLDRDETATLRKDYGANYFNSLDIDFEINLAGSSHGTLTAIGVGPALTVTATGAQNGFATTDVSVMVLVLAGPVYRIRLSRGADVAQDDYIGASTDTVYYCTMTRSAASDTITLAIYSDSARSVLVDTLSVSGYGTGTRYRYMFGVNSPNDAQSGRAIDYVVKNIDLNRHMSGTGTFSGAMTAAIAASEYPVWSAVVPRNTWTITAAR